MIRVCVVGEGAIGRAHLKALARISEVEVVALVGGEAEQTRAVAAQHGVPGSSTDLTATLERDDVDAVVLCTPTHLHAAQAVQVLRAGRHCLVEIPMADSLAASRELAAVAAASDRVAMVCHTRRFNPGHAWLHRRFVTGELRLQHLVAETFFLRRTNTNALGEQRSWTDHLLWHHACHSVDLLRHQTGEAIARAQALQGPVSPALGIATDLSVGLATESGTLLSLALSFNNDGPFGTTFRYICDEGTFVARYDDLVTGEGVTVDVAGPASPDGTVVTDGIELQDREFLAAIREGRPPTSSIVDALETMRVLDRLERTL